MEPKNLTRFGNVFLYNAEAKLFLEQFFANTTANATFGEFMHSPIMEGHASYAAVTAIGALGFLTNSLLVYLSFFNKNLTRDFKTLFGNLAIADMIFSLGLILGNLLYPYLIYGLGKNFKKCLGLRVLGRVHLSIGSCSGSTFPLVPY